MKLNILGITLQVDWLVKMLMQLLVQVLDKIVAGENLSDDQKRGVRTYYFLGNEWGKKAVADTDNELDDEVLASTLELCEDTAQEGGFDLPTG